jgi:hypothetical protein
MLMHQSSRACGSTGRRSTLLEVFNPSEIAQQPKDLQGRFGHCSAIGIENHLDFIADVCGMARFNGPARRGFHFRFQHSMPFAWNGSERSRPSDPP